LSSILDSIYGDPQLNLNKRTLTNAETKKNAQTNEQSEMVRNYFHYLEWIELPGPAEIWPDDPIYYIQHGFEIRPERANRHMQALELLGKTKAPKEWMDSIVHEND